MSQLATANSVSTAPGTIYWHELSVTVQGRVLLHVNSGCARAGRLLGILGPSGAGKSTLLAAFSGVLPPHAHISGAIWQAPGNQAVGVAEGTVALLEQQSPFITELTVNETLQFAAELEGLPSKVASVYVASSLARVGLASIASRRIGQPRFEAAGCVTSEGCAITCGELRRLAVACAIAGDKDDSLGPGCGRALLADEPTTGLDAFQAARVVGLLKELAISRNCVVISTVHQPRASIWSMFDDVLLMAPGGHVVFAGQRDEALQHFASLGQACPCEGVNPAEFLIDLVSVDTEDAGGANASRARIDFLASSFRQRMTSHAGELQPQQSRVKRGASRGHLGPSRAFRLLLWRSLKQLQRDRLTNVLRVLAICGLALFFSAHFGRLDGGGVPSAKSVATRVCLISFGVLAIALLTMARALHRFAQEKAIVAQERTSRRYSGGVYLAAKAVTELPLDAASAGIFAAILHQMCALHADALQVISTFAMLAVSCAAMGLAIGASTPRAEQAVMLGAPVMIMHMLTGIIDPAGDAAPPPLGIMLVLRRISPIRYAIEALCIAELRGMHLARRAADAPRMGGLALVQTGDEVLQRLGIGGEFEDNLFALLSLACAHLLAAVIALVLGRPRFAKSDVTVNCNRTRLQCAGQTTVVPVNQSTE